MKMISRLVFRKFKSKRTSVKAGRLQTQMFCPARLPALWIAQSPEEMDIPAFIRKKNPELFRAERQAKLRTSQADPICEKDGTPHDAYLEIPAYLRSVAGCTAVHGGIA